MNEYIILGLTLFLTICAYLFVPTIFCICRKKFALSKIKLIVILNGICVWLVFRIMFIDVGSNINSAAVFIWSTVAYWLMKKYCLKTSDDGEPTKKFVITQVKKTNIENIQTQKPKKKRKALVFVVIVLSIFLIGSVICNITQYASNEQMNKQIAELEKEPEYIVNYPDVYYENTEKAEFLDENIVFVIDDYGNGNYFFTYDEMMSAMKDQEEFYFRAYNKQFAINEGYIAAYKDFDNDEE